MGMGRCKETRNPCGVGTRLYMCLLASLAHFMYLLFITSTME